MELAPGSKEHRTFYAQLANAAYDGPDKAVLPEGYEIDAGYSGRDHILAVNHSKRHAVLAWRGTDLKNQANKWRDLGTDAALALGYKRWTTRFRSAVKVAKKVSNQYADYALAFTGHSLAGSLAAHAHSKVPRSEYIGYGAHTPLDELKDHLSGAIVADFLKPKRKQSTDYVTLSDPVSAFTLATSYKKKTFVVPQVAKNPHSIHNFLT